MSSDMRSVPDLQTVNSSTFWTY